MPVSGCFLGDPNPEFERVRCLIFGIIGSEQCTICAKHGSLINCWSSGSDATLPSSTFVKLWVVVHQCRGVYQSTLSTDQWKSTSYIYQKRHGIAQSSPNRSIVSSGMPVCNHKKLESRPGVGFHSTKHGCPHYGQRREPPSSAHSSPRHPSPWIPETRGKFRTKKNGWTT